MVFAGADGEGAVHSGEGCQMGCRGHFGIEYEDMGEDRVGDVVNLKKLGRRKCEGNRGMSREVWRGIAQNTYMAV